MTNYFSEFDSICIRCRLSSDEGFDQFGSLFGQVILKNGDSKDTIELNLPGVRTSRSLDMKTTKLIPGTWSLVAACKDGLVVSLSARNIENNETFRIYSGCVRMPNMEVHRVEDIDLDVTVFETKDSTPKDICFSIKSKLLPGTHIP